MAKFKKIPPCYHLSSCGASLGVGVEVLENIDGKDVFVQKSSADAYPFTPKDDAFTLENQLKAGVNLKEVSLEKVVNDFDRMENQFNSLSSRIDEMEKSLTASDLEDNKE